MRFVEPKKVLPVLLAAGLAGALSACGSAGAEKASLPAVDAAAAETAGVRIVKPLAQLEGAGLKATGQLRARNAATLSAPATGQITKLHVDVGDVVKKGDALVQIDPSNIAIQVQQARAARAMAEAGYQAAVRELERTKQLRAADGAPPAALDGAQTQHDAALAGFEQAKAALKMAEEVLRDHTLRAPFDGVVTARMAQLGETVATMPPTPVIAVADVGNLEVKLPVPEASAGAVRHGAVLAGTVSPSGAPFRAKVRTVGAVVDLQSRTVEVLADVEGKPSPAMRPGALVEVALQGGDVEGVYVPAEAVRRDGEKLYVWLAAGGKAARRDVEATAISAQYFHVRSGLGPDDQVIRDGASALAEGMALRILR